MILYTPLSESDIFPCPEDAFSNRHCIRYRGKEMVVEELGDGTYQVMQLLSTDPNDFLQSEFVPGAIIR